MNKLKLLGALFALVAVAGIARADSPWYNAADPLDVNNSGSVTPLDALIVINELLTMNSMSNPGAVPNVSAPGVASPNVSTSPSYYWDVNDSGTVTPLDALIVINQLNAAPNSVPEPSTIVSAGIGLAALAFGRALHRKRANKA